MTEPLSKLFTAQATQYAQFRPDYPPELYSLLYEYCGHELCRGFALDVATGSGQAAVELAKTFKHVGRLLQRVQVFAIDTSEEQLKEAKRASNIEYKRATAEKTGVPDRTAQIITVAQALHWFDLPRFWPEVARVLQPGGVFAAWGYGLPICRGNAAATAAVESWAYGEDMLGPYWSARRRLIDEEYASISPPNDIFEPPMRRNLCSGRDCSIDFFVGYLSSWSAYATYRRKHPDRPDPLAEIRGKLLSCFSTDSGEHVIIIEHPIFLILAKRKGLPSS